MGWRGPEEPFNEAQATLKDQIEFIKREIDNQCYMDTYMDNYNTNIKDLEGYQTELAELIKTEMNNNSQIMFDMVLKDNNAIMNSSVQKAASNNIASK